MSTRGQLRNKIRGDLHLWPDTDALQASITSTDTTITVADGTRAPGGSELEVEDELMFVRVQTGNSLTVRRGDRGTTAVAHNSGVQVLIHGRREPTNQELNGLILDGIEWLFPTCMLDVWDDSTTTDASVLYYVIPSAIEFVDELYMETAGSPVTRRHLRYWQKIGSKVYVPMTLPAGRKLTFHGWGRFSRPVADATLLDVGEDLEPAVALYVEAGVVKSREALRTTFTGQSALLNDRAGNIPDLIGSGRDLMRKASEIRNQHGTVRPTMLRKMNRHV